MKIRTITALTLIAAAVAANAQTYSVTRVGNGVSNLTAPKNDIFVTSGFTSGGTNFGKSNFEVWNNGRLTNNQGTYGWNDAIATETGSAISGNPDRGDNAASFGGSATLAKVFSNTNKNLNWIIDGEGVTPDYTLDLLYGGNKYLSPTTGKSHLLILERGMNSGMRVRGITRDSLGSLVATSNFLDLAANRQSNLGFSIDTTEIDGNQAVGAWGLDVSSLGSNLVGFRFEATQALGHGGPDLVGVASMAPVPEPASMLALGAGALALIRRRRSAK